MHYTFLKNIIEMILTNYTCSNCKNKTNEQAIQITGISSQGIDIHIHCHVCSTHAQLNVEINSIATQMLTSEHGKKIFEEFVSQYGTFDSTLITPEITALDSKKIGDDMTRIRDEDIIKIHNDLKTAKSIEDLMS